MNKLKAVFRFGVVLMFFTSMSKILVPGTVFDELQHELSFNAATLASIGAWYMIAYAVSQFGIGLITDRIGGGRVLLLGGSTFCVGMLLFPYCSSFGTMLCARILSGFGAGIVFLGVSKLIADLYPERFSSILGIALVLGYLGPTTGTSAMPWLVKCMGWRHALLLPAVLSSCAMLGILAFIKGTIKPVVKGQSLWRPVIQVMGQWDIIRLYAASSLVFGSYYALLTLMGRKCLEDICGFSTNSAAMLVTLLTIIVAFFNLMAGPICRVIKNHHGLTMQSLSLLSMAGAILGWAILRFQFPSWTLFIAYVMVAVPAGFFPVYGTMAKDACPSQCVALAVALLNFWAFVMISAVGAIAGHVMRSHEDIAEHVGNILVYPPVAYQDVFVVFIIVGVIGLLCTIGLFKNKRQA